MHAHQKARVFPGKYRNPRRAQGTEGTHNTHFRQSLHLRRQTQKPRFPREIRTFAFPAFARRASKRVQTCLLAPTFRTPKPRVFPGKYAHDLNSALRGSSYRAKTPGFHDPNALKNTKKAPKNQTTLPESRRAGFFALPGLTTGHPHNFGPLARTSAVA